MSDISFSERVKNEAIIAASAYKHNFVDCEYLLCSDAFENKDYYIIDAKEDNYQHLIGVNSLISAQEFFNKCYNATLQEADFNFNKKNQSEKSVKGSVRRKLSVLSNMVNIFENRFLVQEDFVKNKIVCTLAAADDTCTLGFIDTNKARPKSLLSGNGLEKEKAKKVSLVLKKHINQEKFDEIVIGNFTEVMKYYDVVQEHIGEMLSSQILELNVQKLHIQK